MRYLGRVVAIEAWQILSVAPLISSAFELSLDERGAVIAEPKQLGNHIPVPGDYWIQLSESDQYLCPKAVFEAKYMEEPVFPTIRLTFGIALLELKAGKRVAREGWNGKGMWLSYSPGSPDLPAAKFWSPHNAEFAQFNGGTADVLPCITMKTADGKILMGWLASQTDMLAEDWMVLPA